MPLPFSGGNTSNEKSHLLAGFFPIFSSPVHPNIPTFSFLAIINDEMTDDLLFLNKSYFSRKKNHERGISDEQRSYGNHLCSSEI
ncbi:MAG: hypothetical protein K6D57_02575 [Paludibacteraceae bacterium]|nr:hypothetical protein [Paludibacteraceae bacterium]